MEPLSLPQGPRGDEIDRAVDHGYAKGYRNGWQGSLSALAELIAKRATNGISKQALLRDIEDVRKVVGNG